MEKFKTICEKEEIYEIPTVIFMEEMKLTNQVNDKNVDHYDILIAGLYDGNKNSIYLCIAYIIDHLKPSISKIKEKIISTLAHETRHAWQVQTGNIRILEAKEKNKLSLRRKILFILFLLMISTLAIAILDIFHRNSLTLFSFLFFVTSLFLEYIIYLFNSNKYPLKILSEYIDRSAEKDAHKFTEIAIQNPEWQELVIVEQINIDKQSSPSN